jgi:TatD DNase family protein
MIDSHCHLDMFEDWKEVTKRAKEAGVSEILSIATDESSFFKCLEIVKQIGGIMAIGIHPHESKNATSESFKLMRTLLLNNREIVAIGEMGLDFYKKFSPKEVQEDVFRRQLELAKELNLPIIIHCRDAYDRLLEILDQEGPPQVGIVHCFSASKEIGQEFLKRNFYLSFAGPLTYPNSVKLRETALCVPLDRILLESDAPFLPPQSHRGKRNEPALIVETYKTLAEIKGMNLEELKETIRANFHFVIGSRRRKENGEV